MTSICTPELPSSMVCFRIFSKKDLAPFHSLDEGHSKALWSKWGQELRSVRVPYGIRWAGTSWRKRPSYILVKSTTCLFWRFLIEDATADCDGDPIDLNQPFVLGFDF